jgi:hypothetical protein
MSERNWSGDDAGEIGLSVFCPQSGSLLAARLALAARSQGALDDQC